MLSLLVYTAYWTPEDVAHGANDPERTTGESHEFDDADELVDHLIAHGLTEPSCWPVTSNETRIWFSAPSYEHPYTGHREYLTAHRGDDIDDGTWTRIVHRITACAA
ncbi:hypothetical protein KIH74_28720 [Kineosporia sp. J2-2]|uniref:Uncharacterized protein n=1 Tax=Kineosporia corallincola TaxID=2835133 RepID=A0ABS5TQY4_9ACTN|nr:hypothetical protein [Kineosporia corallincola]MBT0772961.1 hypothetical protein [Kineosporia corallincola]